jgi:hypothetical protein
MRTQTEQVIEIMRNNGGYATFGQLNTLVDFSTWKTKTPQATIRRIVQDSNAFFKIRPGLWALKECESAVLETFNIKTKDKEQQELFTHSYYQGIVVEIGNMKGFNTYIPPQDKNKLFLEKPLRNLATLSKIHNFTYPEILKQAATIDTIWFNTRNFPDSCFEVEHSTNIEHSLVKFTELQDYFARFFIVADKSRRNQFDNIMNKHIFGILKKRVFFADYESIVNQYTNMCKTLCVI